MRRGIEKRSGSEGRRACKAPPRYRAANQRQACKAAAGEGTGVVQATGRGEGGGGEGRGANVHRRGGVLGGNRDGEGHETRQMGGCGGRRRTTDALKSRGASARRLHWRRSKQENCGTAGHSRHQAPKAACKRRRRSGERASEQAVRAVVPAVVGAAAAPLESTPSPACGPPVATGGGPRRPGTPGRPFDVSS